MIFRRITTMKLQANNKLVMIGDSITDCGRTQPVGEGLFGPHGNGYVNLVSALLGSVYPELGLRVVNMGTSGHTVKDLEQRWQTDVVDLKPDWLSIMIGTNDVWRQFDMPLQTEGHILPDEYEKTYDSLIHRTLPLVKGLVLMTPFYIEANTEDAMRARMDEYGAIVRKLAEKYNTLFVDTQAAFNQLLRHCHSAAIAWDRVHPNATGHMVLAKVFLDAMGFEWR
jgi:lysophospholipase L1-like esterase